MELAASPYHPSLLSDLSCQQSKATNTRPIITGTSNSTVSSMSQGFHQGIFGFSDGFDRQTQQDQQQQQETAIYEPAVPGANMLSEMFNFTPSGISATDLLANQISAGYRLHRPPAPAASPGFGGDWYGTAHRPDTATVVASTGSGGSGGLGLGPLVDMATKQNHHTIPGLNADSAAAMQLFLMNPQQQVQQPRSPSPPSPAPHAIPLHHDFDAAAAAASFAGGVVEGQGLSLSLNSPLQQFEMAKAEELRVRDGLLYYNSQNPLQLQGQQSQQQGQPSHVGFSGPMGMVNVLRHSKYARAAQELLEEFCSVGRGQPKGGGRKGKRPSSSNHNRNSTQVGGGGGGGASSSSSKDPPTVLSPPDRFEHQRKKAKLLSMLDEVDRRYNHYCEQMQMVVNSFDTVMGFGAATPYTGLAQKAMSRHFRCLKDEIAAQLKHTCELLGEKDGGIGSGITKGETPRLKMLDQSLRQQRSFHQMGMMEQEAWRPQRGLPERSVNILRAWLFEHFLHPYPSDADKHLLARQTGLTRNQVSNWFINARVRLWKPMVEEMYVQESKEEDKDKGDQASQSSSQQLSQAQKHDTSTTTAAETKINHSQLTPLSIPKQQHQPFSSPSSSDNPLSVGSGNVGAIAGMELPTAANVGGIDGQMVNYGAGMVGSGTQRRFGAPGDVSLTLGLRHAGNTPENSRFSLRDFTGR